MYNLNGTQSMIVSNSAAKWSRLENKLFEESLVRFPDEIPDRWEKIAGMIPGKSPEEVIAHYENLLSEIDDIESGRVEIPDYVDDEYFFSASSSSESESESEEVNEPNTAAPIYNYCSTIKSNSTAGAERKRKGIPWTIEEHRLFLQGVTRFGWGDWRNVSRNSVVTRTPSQVASHAQKYQNRQNSVKKVKKRFSIHDITTSADCKTVFAPTTVRNHMVKTNKLKPPFS